MNKSKRKSNRQKSIGYLTHFANTIMDLSTNLKVQFKVRGMPGIVSGDDYQKIGDFLKEMEDASQGLYRLINPHAAARDDRRRVDKYMPLPAPNTFLGTRQTRIISPFRSFSVAPGRLRAAGGAETSEA